MTKIYIEDNLLDINAQLSNQITYAIDDIRNIDSKATPFTKTIVLPGTAKNNNLLGNIFELNNSNDTNNTNANVGYNFNAARTAKCRIDIDGMTLIKGTFRLLEIIIDGSNIEYECSVLGELGGFVTKLGAAKLEDLDFSAYNHVWDANIVSSWDNAGGSGYVYPLIDYGNVGLTTGNILGGKHGFTQNAFRPALFVKEYIDKIFAAVGYTYECSLFNTTRFKNLIVPFNRAKMTFKTTNLIDAKRTTTYSVVSRFTSSNEVVLQQSKTMYQVFTTTDNGTWTYIGEPTINFLLFWDMNFTIDMPYASGKFIDFNLYKNNTLIATQRKTSGTTFRWTQVTPTGYSLSLAKNDNFSLRIETNMVLNPADTYTIKYTTGTFKTQSEIAQTVEYLGSETILINELIPKNILQKDFFTSIIKLFNLYIDEDRFNDKHLIIKPYVDYYLNNVEDWTLKVDRSKPIKVKPMSELNSRYYSFKFKNDSDYYNDLYQKAYNQGYGELIYDSTFEFAKETAKLELIFSPTPLVGYVGEDKVISTIFKRSGNSAPYTEERIDSNIRILQYKKITGVSSWNLRNISNTSTLASPTVYPYAGHLDSPDVPSNDIQFGVPKELYFSLLTGGLNVNQFNVYYSPYMAEITDKDSKLLTCEVKLNDVDVFNLDFAKYYFIDGGLYRLTKLIDYTPNSNETTKAEFLKLINKVY
jgi:hypothetical protein